MSIERPLPPIPGFFQVTEYIAGNLADAKPVYSLEYLCPCGCGDPGWLPLITQASQRQSSPCWEWDQNRVRPTLSPSIRRLIKCKFHGWLKAGVWTSAGDGAPVHPTCYKGGDPLPPHLESRPMTENAAPDESAGTVKPTAPDNAAPAAPRADKAPPGYFATLVLHFFEGILHQLHVSGHPGEGKEVWVPIGGQNDPPKTPAEPPASTDKEGQPS